MTNSSIHAPEVSLSADPEVDHDPQLFPPELVLVEGIEAKYDGLEHLDLNQSQPVAKEQLPRNKNPFKLTWPWIILCATVIIALGIGVGVGVGVGVGNNLKHHSRDSAQSVPSTTPTPNPSGDAPEILPTILKNSSLASSVCPDGDRWVFFQNPQGYLRGAQYRNAKWTVTSRQLFKSYFSNLPVTPMPGTSLGASCPNTTQLSPNPHVAYIDIHGVLWESLISEGTWVTPQAFGNTSAKNTKISIFANEGNDISSNLSSVAFFQRGNGSYAVAELSDWLTSFSVDPALASSPLSAERRLSDVPSKQLASFACVMNAQERFNDRYLDMYCFINDTMWMWQYPSGSLSNQTEDIIDHYKTDLKTSDISLSLVDDNKIAVVSIFQGVVTVNTIQQDTLYFYSNNSFHLNTNLSSSHISSSSLGNSSEFYIYYQANDTALAEVTFSLDTASRFSDPVYIPIPDA